MSLERRVKSESTRTPGLITTLLSRPNKTVEIIAFGNNLPHDRFHFELLTEKSGNKIRFTRINELSFKKALTWFEQEMQSITQTPRQPIVTLEDGYYWQLRQEERLGARALPELRMVLGKIAEMKTKACQALGIPILPSKPVV